MVEHVLLKQVCLVQEKNGMDPVTPEIFDVGRYGEKDGGGRGGRRKAEGETKLSVEITTSERGVVAVGQAESCLWETVFESPKHAGLADTGLAREEYGGVLRALKHRLPQAGFRLTY